ncbi:MAG: alpha/beta hydrolase [Syntrophomonadaceae bacterium]|jgi:carboxylesterase
MKHINPSAESFILSGSKDIALLFLHGFTASPSELYPTARLIHELSGLTICAPLLPGHGLTPDELNQYSWEQWYGAVEREIISLKQSNRQVFIGGLSMGALLSLHAARCIPGLKGAIAINAPIYYHTPMLTAISSLIGWIKPFYPKKTSMVSQKLKDKGRFAYDVIPVKAFGSLDQLRKEVINEVAGIKIPVLLIQSLQDESVQACGTYYLRERIPKSQLLELSHSGHIATMGEEVEKIAQAIVKFII